jgi:acyl carrier protein
MTKEEILAELTQIFRGIFDDDDLQITPATSADDISEWDSLKHINIVVAAEMEFKVKFQTSEIESLKNVGELVDLIAAKVAHR